MHTPGPWRHYSGPLRPQYPTVIHEIQTRSGRAVVKWAGFDGLELTKKETKANARLIAAAPDMLAALKWAEIQLTTWCAGSGEGSDCLPEIRAAIVKAQGRTKNPSVNGEKL